MLIDYCLSLIDAWLILSGFRSDIDFSFFDNIQGGPQYTLNKLPQKYKWKFGRGNGRNSSVGFWSLPIFVNTKIQISKFGRGIWSSAIICFLLADTMFWAEHPLNWIRLTKWMKRIPPDCNTNSLKLPRVRPLVSPKLPRVPHKGGAGAGVGVLRGAGDYLTWK